LRLFTVTQDQELALLDTSDMDYETNPDFLTDSLKMTESLLRDALKNEDDVDQMKAYLESLKRCDKTVDYWVGRGTDGTVTGFVWQTV